MIKQTEALKLALSVLDEVRSETFRLMRNGQKLYAEEKVWNAIFVIKQALAEQPEQCRHRIADARNPVVKSGYLCVDCGALFAAADHTKQPAQQQEPFGYFKPEPFGWTDCAETDEGAIALYDRPPASKPLTDEQIMEMYNEPRSDAEMIAFARAIEAAHGITGEQK